MNFSSHASSNIAKFPLSEISIIGVLLRKSNILNFRTGQAVFLEVEVKDENSEDRESYFIIITQEHFSFLNYSHIRSKYKFTSIKRCFWKKETRCNSHQGHENDIKWFKLNLDCLIEIVEEYRIAEVIKLINFKNLFDFCDNQNISLETEHVSTQHHTIPIYNYLQMQFDDHSFINILDITAMISNKLKFEYLIRPKDLFYREMLSCMEFNIRVKIYHIYETGWIALDPPHLTLYIYMSHHQKDTEELSHIQPGSFVIFQSVLPVYIWGRLKGFACTIRTVIYRDDIASTSPLLHSHAHIEHAVPHDGMNTPFRIDGDVRQTCYLYTAWKCMTMHKIEKCVNCNGHTDINNAIVSSLTAMISHTQELTNYNPVLFQYRNKTETLLESFKLGSRSIQHEFADTHHLQLHLVRSGHDADWLNSLLPKVIFPFGVNDYMQISQRSQQTNPNVTTVLSKSYWHYEFLNLHDVVTSIDIFPFFSSFELMYQNVYCLGELQNIKFCNYFSSHSLVVCNIIDRAIHKDRDRSLRAFISGTEIQLRNLFREVIDCENINDAYKLDLMYMLIRNPRAIRVRNFNVNGHVNSNVNGNVNSNVNVNGVSAESFDSHFYLFAKAEDVHIVQAKAESDSDSTIVPSVSPHVDEHLSGGKKRRRETSDKEDQRLQGAGADGLTLLLNTNNIPSLPLTTPTLTPASTCSIKLADIIQHRENESQGARNMSLPSSSAPRMGYARYDDDLITAKGVRQVLHNHFAGINQASAIIGVVIYQGVVMPDNYRKSFTSSSSSTSSSAASSTKPKFQCNVIVRDIEYADYMSIYIPYEIASFVVVGSISIFYDCVVSKSASSRHIYGKLKSQNPLSIGLVAFPEEKQVQFVISKSHEKPKLLDYMESGMLVSTAPMTTISCLETMKHHDHCLWRMVGKISAVKYLGIQMKCKICFAHYIISKAANGHVICSKCLKSDNLQPYWNVTLVCDDGTSECMVDIEGDCLLQALDALTEGFALDLRNVKQQLESKAKTNGGFKYDAFFASRNATEEQFHQDDQQNMNSRNTSAPDFDHPFQSTSSVVIQDIPTEDIDTLLSLFDFTSNYYFLVQHVHRKNSSSDKLVHKVKANFIKMQEVNRKYRFSVSTLSCPTSTIESLFVRCVHVSKISRDEIMTLTRTQLSFKSL